MATRSKPPLIAEIGYGIGEGPNSLVTNGISTFGLLYYTEILHLSPAIAGAALSLSIIWEAVTEPLMGYVSDRTRTRFGARMPWIAAGGLIVALAIYLFWHAPVGLSANPLWTTVYLVAVNILLRTGLTMYFIPYLALGFELSPSYDGRSRLQSFRWVFNMIVNFAGPALAWSVFFTTHTAADGTKIDGTAIASNYQAMSAAFAAAILVMTALLVSSSLRGGPTAPETTHPRRFWTAFADAVRDPNMCWLLGFSLLVQIALMTVVSLQTYAYVFVLELHDWQRSVAHGATMVGMAAGAFASAGLCRRFDKKPVVIAGVIAGVAAHGLYGLWYLSGFAAGAGSVGFVVFVLFHGTYWAASGFIFPVVTAMIGDSAELRSAGGGAPVEGIYSAALSLSMRIAFAIGLFAGGWLLTSTGFDPGGGGAMTQGARNQLVVLLFFAAPAISLLGLPALLRHPLNRASFGVS